jgi:glycosyltransferase involved in cell wall biosynthesis
LFTKDAREVGNVDAAITIITVCRNSAVTIGRTIESVLAQKEPDVEYIVIDGASSDGTQQMVRSYGAAIDHFVSEPDLGIADAFNKGISLARGAIIALINADDALLDGALAAVRSYLEAHPEVSVVHGDVLLYHGEKYVKRLKPAGRWWYPWRLVLFNHPATFVRREVYRRHGPFLTGIAIAMDVEIFLRWMKQGVRICYLPEPLVGMRAGGVSGRQAKQGFLEVRRALIGHGFSPALAQLQYAGKCIVHFLLSLKGSSSAP